MDVNSSVKIILANYLIARQSYVPLEYSRKLSVSGREKRCHKSSPFRLIEHGMAKLGLCLSARPLVVSLDTGIEFLASSHWAEERENHRGSCAR